MEQRTVYCASCPCLTRVQITDEYGNIEYDGWACGIDEFDLAEIGKPRNKVCRMGGCQLKRIELLDGSVIHPDERSIW
jgi:hypothetical protein